MEKYANAIGGRSLLSNVTSQVSVYTLTLMGLRLTVTTTVAAPSSYLQVVRQAGGETTLETGFDGKLAWLRGPDGVVHFLTGQKRAELIAEASGSNNSEIFGDRWPTTLRLQPPETIDGKTYYVVRIAPKDGVAHDMLLDAQTFRPTMDRTVETDATTTSMVNQFSTGPMGELNAASVTTTRSDGFPATTSILQSVHDNVHLPKTFFSPPASKGTETI